MKYDDCLKELAKVGIKGKFVSEYEQKENPVLLKMFKETDKIHGTANLVKNLMKLNPENSELREYWKKVFFYFITPKFARIKNF